MDRLVGHAAGVREDRQGQHCRTQVIRCRAPRVLPLDQGSRCSKQPLDPRRQLLCCQTEHLQLPTARCYLLVERPRPFRERRDRKDVESPPGGPGRTPRGGPGRRPLRRPPASSASLHRRGSNRSDHYSKVDGAARQGWCGSPGFSARQGPFGATRRRCPAAPGSAERFDSSTSTPRAVGRPAARGGSVAPGPVHRFVRVGVTKKPGDTPLPCTGSQLASSPSAGHAGTCTWKQSGSIRGQSG